MTNSVEEKLERKLKDGKIYKYFDGYKTIWEDPFVIDERYLLACEKEDIQTLDSWSELPKDEDGNILKDITDAQIRLYNKAMFRFIPLICKAFDVKRFDAATGEGLTGEEILRLQHDFLTWKLSLKKNTDE